MELCLQLNYELLMVPSLLVIHPIPSCSLVQLEPVQQNRLVPLDATSTAASASAILLPAAERQLHVAYLR